MSTAVKNFAKGTVSTGYDAVATSIVLSTGHGSRFPSTFPFPIVWWNATDYADPADDPAAEVGLVTNRVGDTLTVTRGAEGTAASAKNTASKTYKIIAPITAEMWDGLQERSLSQTFRALRVETHPDADLAASRLLFSAGSIVMDDGEEVPDWNSIEVDLAASGANGLDTGTEAASAWYSLWAAHNGTTKIGLLHREKEYFLDEDVSAGEDGTHALRDAAARTKLGQGFQVDTAGPMPFVDVKLAKVGTPTGLYWFTIESNSGGVASGTALATSVKYDVSRLTTASTWVRIYFRSPATLSALTQYHLVLQGNFTVSGANYMSWRADTTAAAYSRGSKAAYDGATWTADTDDDFTFKAYVTRNDTALTLPTGYTQSAKIGYAYNDAGSNLKHFIQQDRTVFCGYDDAWQIGSLSATTPALVSLEAFLPPTDVVAELLFYSATSLYVGIGTLMATDLTTTQTDERVGIVRKYTAGTPEGIPRLTLSAYQGLMFITSGGTPNLYVGTFEW